VLCCAVCPIYNLLLPGRGIRTASNRPGTTPSPSRGPLGPLEPQPARHCFVTGPVLSLHRGGGGAVRLQFRSRPQLGVRPHPVLTTYLPCFSNPSRLSQFPPNVKTQCKNNWDLELSFSKFGIYNSQFENLGFRITNVKHWDLELSM